MGANFEDDPSNPNPVPLGSRATDGNFLSVREAYRVFATKEQLESMGDTLKIVASRVDGLPTTRELEARWKAEDERYTRFEAWLAKVDGAVDAINSRAWVTPTLAIVVPIILVAIVYLITKNHP